MAQHRTQHYHLGPEVVHWPGSLRQCDPVRMGESALAAPGESLRVTCLSLSWATWAHGDAHGRALAARHRQHPPWLGAPLLWSVSGQAFLAFSDDEALQATARAEYGQPRPSNARWWAAPTQCRGCASRCLARAAPSCATRCWPASARWRPRVRCPGPCGAVLTALGASNGFDARPGGSICPGWWKKRRHQCRHGVRTACLSG